MNFRNINHGILAAAVVTTLVCTAGAGDKKRGADGQQDRQQQDSNLFDQQALQLSVTQQEQVHSLRTKELTEVNALRAEEQTIRTEIRKQWEKEKLDKAKIQKLHSQLQEIRSKMADARLAFRLGVYDILTSEQKKQVAKERAAFHANWTERRESNRFHPRGEFSRDDDGGYGGHGRGMRRGRGMGRGGNCGIPPVDFPLW